MSSDSDIPTPHTVSTYIEEGARIAAILAVWGVIAAFFIHSVSEIGGHGSIFETLGPQIGVVFALTGILNAALYLLYRAIDYYNDC